MSSPTCQSQYTNHSGSILTKYSPSCNPDASYSVIGYLCELHNLTDSYCSGCKLFVAKSDMRTAGLCIADSMSPRCFATMISNLSTSLVNQSTYNAFTLAQATVNQTVAKNAANVKSMATTLKITLPS